MYWVSGIGSSNADPGFHVPSDGRAIVIFVSFLQTCDGTPFPGLRIIVIDSILNVVFSFSPPALSSIYQRHVEPRVPARSLTPVPHTNRSASCSDSCLTLQLCEHSGSSRLRRASRYSEKWCTTPLCVHRLLAWVLS